MLTISISLHCVAVQLYVDNGGLKYSPLGERDQQTTSSSYLSERKLCDMVPEEALRLNIGPRTNNLPLPPPGHRPLIVLRGLCPIRPLRLGWIFSGGCMQGLETGCCAVQRAWLFIWGASRSASIFSWPELLLICFLGGASDK